MARDVRAGRGGRFVSTGDRRAPRARYPPIAEHGLIGDLHTAGLRQHRHVEEDRPGSGPSYRGNPPVDMRATR